MLEPIMLVKLIHVISSAVLFCGVLSASVFFTLAYRTGEAAVITTTAQFCRMAATLTAAAMVVQPVTGLILIKLMEDSPTQPWLMAAYALYLAVLAAWLVATSLLGKVAATVRDSARDARVFRLWAPLSWGSVLVVCAIYYLMLAQPALWASAG